MEYCEAVNVGLIYAGNPIRNEETKILHFKTSSPLVVSVKIWLKIGE
jgi:hypothetical protein